MAKTKTSTEVKQRWENANYKKYLVRLRIDTDKDLIEFVEQLKDNGAQTSEIFKDALQALKNEG